MVNPADRDIPEELVEKAAAALATFTCSDPDQWKWYTEHAELALSAALAGRQVVALPEPVLVLDAQPGVRAHTVFDVDSYVVTALAMDQVPRVNVRGGPIMPPDEAEQRGAALIAAAREARRLAAGSGSGED